MSNSKVANFYLPLKDEKSEHYRHLLFALEQIDLRLQYYTDLNRERLERHILDDFLLETKEIDDYLNIPRGAPHWMRKKSQALPPPYINVEPGGLLSNLAEQFELTQFEIDVLLLGMLTFIDSRYCSLFSALQRSGQKTQASFELAIELLGSDNIECEEFRLGLLPQSPLIKYGLITVDKSSDKKNYSWNQSLFQTSMGVCQYLTGNRYFSPSLTACSQWYPPVKNEGLSNSEIVQNALMVQEKKSDNDLHPMLILESGSDLGIVGSIRSAALKYQRAVISLNMSLLPKNDKEVMEILTEACREARMRDAILVLQLQENRDDNEDKSPSHVPKNWMDMLHQANLRVVLLCACQGQFIEHSNMPKIILDVPGLSQNEKASLLTQHLTKHNCTELDVTVFSRRFSFNCETLPIILQEADSYRQLRDPFDELRECDLNKAFGVHARKDFGNLAQRKEPRRTLDDLVVPEEVKEQLMEILVAAKHRNNVLEQGFATKVGYGTGISALFCGDSGTGKTMAAEVIAGQLGVDLIKVDLSTVVNKYIGETEKNIARIFDLAQSDAGVLFFDEADALFGKRTAVSDSKDRHANIGVAYLLQRLESHTGLVILATNNRNHLDDAFSRRFTFITSFKFPDAKQREELWHKIWPVSFEVSPEVNFSQLSKRAELTGANIRNVAILSAWLAREEQSKCILERHIHLAIRRELAKVGRLPI
ncbi:ATP-binding protein [Aeromonas sp. SG16]|uniref:ATP-binding protein n=1 Tax=Aeromonas sp. SG16 TaxID=2950548 RepID=UPI00210A627F|nr:ATP-binding protein [Aeromonas sp. SG16]MCQ4054449.1 ATP-binding protein [Aeromonas sp. SG16]